MLRPILSWITVASAVTVTARLACADVPRLAHTEGAPSRIVSLVPSSTDIILALGGGSRLVARTDYDDAPSLVALPSIGSTTEPSIEAIVALRPDLVIVWNDANVSRAGEKLRSLGIRTEAVSASTLRDFDSVVLRLGRLLAVPARADSLVAAVADSLQTVRASTESLGRKRVFYMVWHHPIITTGPGTFIDSLLTVAGGRNIFGDARSDWPTVELEQVIARDPDVIVWAIEGGREARRGRDLATLGRRSLWTRLRAVRAGRLVIVDASRLNRPDSHVGQSARVLAEAIHAAEQRHVIAP